MLGDCSVMPLVGVADLDRARAFYCDVLGLTPLGEDPFALTVGCAGTTMRLTRVDEPTPAAHSILAWRVPEITAAVDRLSAAGVEFLRYDGVGQDERAVWTAPGGARIAWFLDPDGHNLSVVEMA